MENGRVERGSNKEEMSPESSGQEGETLKEAKQVRQTRI